MARPMRTRLAAPLPAGIGSRARSVFSSQSKSMRLAAGQVRSARLPRKLQHDLAGLRRGEFHGQDAVLELHRLQLGGGVDDVFAVGEGGTFLAQTAARQRHFDRAARANRRRATCTGGIAIACLPDDRSTRRSPLNGCADAFTILRADATAGVRDSN